MNPPKTFGLVLLLATLLFTVSAVGAQEVFTSYRYRVDVNRATAPPDLGNLPSIEFPDKARKRGVEGTMVAKIVLKGDGRIGNITFEDSLANGLEESFRKAFSTYRFRPARLDTEPVDAVLTIQYTVEMIFDERDKSVRKPKVTDKPEPAYPESERAEKRKGKVTVGILFRKDGTLRILSVASTMPRPFDNAAAKAAESIKFDPGVHKKTKKPVSVKMFVEYKFKP